MSGHRPGPRWPLEAASLAPALAAGLGLVRLTREPTAAHVVLPVAAAVVAGQLVTAATRRLAGPAVAVVGGVVAVALTTLWCVVPSATTWGLPSVHSLHAVHHALAQAWDITRSTPTPVPAAPGVVMWMAAGAGWVAVCGRAVLGAGPVPGTSGGRRSLWSLAPGAAVFCYAALFSSGSGRAVATAGYLAGVALFVMAADAAVTVWRGRNGAARVLATGAVMVGAGVAVPLALGPELAGMHLSAFAATPVTGRPLPLFGGALDLHSLVDTSFLVDDLGAVLGDQPDTLLFTAKSEVPTYWQVATLDSFEGSRWVADPATAAVALGTTDQAGAPPSLPAPLGATFSATVRLVGLQTDLLPVPPGTSSVSSGDAVVVKPVGVVLPDGALSGSSVTVRAIRPRSVLASEVAVPSGARMAPYLVLPPLPSEVVALAHRIVANAAKPLAKALALTGYFQESGFHYSTAANDAGPQPLETFLFGTHTGFCQQFAGAFAVLARADGLPTRLAVGFTAGAALPGGTYRVTAADAHVWPEVYLGPQLGWVSFEPTPPSGDGPVRPLGVLTAPAPAGGGGVQSLAGGSLKGGALPFTGTSVPGTGAVPPASAPGGPRPVRRSSSAWWHPLVVAASVTSAIGVVIGALVQGRRRRRSGRARRTGPRRRRTPTGSVVADWQRAHDALARRRLGRRPEETLVEHAGRVAPRLDGAADAYRRLAELAARAGYSSELLAERDSAASKALRREVTHSLRARRRQSVPV